MERHDPRFGKTKKTEEIGDTHNKAVSISRKNPLGNIDGIKIKGSTENIDDNHCRQQERLRRKHQVNDIFFGSSIPFLILMVHDQRIGKNGNNFVEQVESKQVTGKSGTHRSAN